MAKKGKKRLFLRLLLFLVATALLFLAASYLPEDIFPASPARVAHKNLVQVRKRIFGQQPTEATTPKVSDEIAFKPFSSPAPPQPDTSLSKQREPISYAGNRYYAGMPQPTKEFRDHIKVLDNIGYSTGYCTERKTPAWAAYKITRHPHVAAPKRPDKFLPDPRVLYSPVSNDYSNSGFDRGHMAPNHIIALCYGADAQKETFLLTNIIPQKPQLNREVWENLERIEAETYSDRYGAIWVIDGPVYGNGSPETLAGGEAIPTACYKIIVREDRDSPKVLAFVMPQNVTGRESPSQFLTSVSEIQKETKLDFLQDLPDDEEAKVEAEKTVGMW